MLCLMLPSTNSAFGTSLAKQTLCPLLTPGPDTPTPMTRTRCVLRAPRCPRADPGGGRADGGAATDHPHSGLSHPGDSERGGSGTALLRPGSNPLPLPGLAQSASRARQCERAEPSPVPHLRHGAAELPPPRPLWSHFRRLPAPDRKKRIKREMDEVPKWRGGAYGNPSGRCTVDRRFEPRCRS